MRLLRKEVKGGGGVPWGTVARRGWKEKEAPQKTLSERQEPAKFHITDAQVGQVRAGSPGQGWAFCTDSMTYLPPSQMRLIWVRRLSGYFIFQSLWGRLDHCPLPIWNSLGHDFLGEDECHYGCPWILLGTWIWRGDPLFLDSPCLWVSPSWRQHTYALHPEPLGSQFELWSIRGLIFNGFYSMTDKSVRERQGAGNA